MNTFFLTEIIVKKLFIKNTSRHSQMSLKYMYFKCESIICYYNQLLYDMLYKYENSTDHRYFKINYLSILSVPDEGYSRNVSCALSLISTFLLKKNGLTSYKTFDTNWIIYCFFYPWNFTSSVDMVL